MRFRVNSTCRNEAGHPIVPGSYRGKVTNSYKDPSSGEEIVSERPDWVIDIDSLEAVKKLADDEGTSVSVEFRAGRGSGTLLFFNGEPSIKGQEVKRPSPHRTAGLYFVDADRDAIAEYAEQAKLLDGEEAQAAERINQIRRLASGSHLARVLLSKDKTMWQDIMNQVSSSESVEADPEAETDKVLRFLESNGIDVSKLTRTLLTAAIQALLIEEILNTKTA